MKTRKVSLNGPWQLTGIDPQGEREIDIPAHVPGHAHHELQAAGIIPDPFWRDQLLESHWVEKWDWNYTREFDLAADLDRRWAVLELEGIDTFATIILNGREVARTTNMFIPYRFEVGELLQAGRNKLEVRILAHGKFFADKPKEEKYWSLFCDDRIYKRKMQCGLGWDWLPRFVSAGIWQPCEPLFL